MSIYSPTEIIVAMKDHMGYREPTTNCGNCEFCEEPQQSGGTYKCTYNRSYPFVVEQYGVCKYHQEIE